MPNHVYIRRPSEGPTPRGWSIVHVPGHPPLEVEEPLATELRTLVAKGQLQEAKTLIFWFDTGAVDEDES